MSAVRALALALALALLGALALRAGPARAEGMAETLPAGTFLLDEGLYLSNLTHMYDDDGHLRPLIDDIQRFEPGGGWQGTIIPDARVRYGLLVSQLQAGVTDSLSVGVGVPLVLWNTVRPSLRWVPGDYQPSIGRAYTEEDFWGWAASMGQPKPGNWSGNEGTLADIVLGARYRFSDHVAALRRHEIAMALTVAGALPTGSPPDPEEVVAAGTTSWDLHAQGELGAHLAIDKLFRRHLDGRLALSAEVFYEVFFEHEYTTPRGTKHPLLNDDAPYVGDTYTIDPGDFFGGSLQVEVAPLRGPSCPTWLVRHDPVRAAALPPMVSFWLRYTFVGLGQSDWESDSAQWDWKHERTWRPGYKNILTGQLTLSLLRVGVPVQLYARLRDLTLLRGRNSRAANVWAFGLQVPARFW